ncbi:MAG: alpha/beta fold hydrolase [Candidatus Hodarchaeota archaeon]
MATNTIPGNIKPKLSAIRAPTLVTHGKGDSFYSVEATKDIATSISGAELLILNRMGHSLPQEIIPRIVSAMVENSTK